MRALAEASPCTAGMPFHPTPHPSQNARRNRQRLKYSPRQRRSVAGNSAGRASCDRSTRPAVRDRLPGRNFAAGEDEGAARGLLPDHGSARTMADASGYQLLSRAVYVFDSHSYYILETVADPTARLTRFANRIEREKNPLIKGTMLAKKTEADLPGRRARAKSEPI